MARKILLADDSVTAQNMGRRILTDAGYDVITVNNGSAALKKATEQKPDLIVLDVYMPGYGGLEVCQRLREAPETARIPILLTVGKLEPFKPEEAKRVRADAYVIKPFEASELLAALTKLEDRIVPEGPAPKPIKNKSFDSSKGEKFGDTETGWKNRLNIPPVRKANAGEEAIGNTAEETAKSSEPEKPAVKTEVAASDALKGNKVDIAASSPQKLPTDITPEEIAALASAAAVIRQKESTPAVSPAVSAQAQDASNKASESSKTEIKTDAAANATSEVIATSSAEKSAPEAAEKSAEQDTKQNTKEDEKDADAAASSAKAEPASAPEPAESEVAAVLASLTPVENKESAKEKEDVPVGAFAQAVAVGASVPSGPRWIAQEIPVTEQDESFSLEQEMEKSAIGKGAASAVAASSAAPASFSAPSSQTESAALNPALTTENEKSPAPQPASASAAVNTSTEAASLPTPSPEINYPPSAPKEPVALAAAASAQPSAPDAISTERVKNELASSAPVGEERQRESQLAAAWENWQTVRESILGSQLASQITEAASETLKEAQKEQPAGAETKAHTSADTPANPTAIASIVDSVLAELKPKLMEEIARKLRSEKK